MKSFALMLICGMVACSTPSTTPSSRSFLIRGTVATGAHTRTPVSRGYVGLMLPGWVVIKTTRVTTNTDGSYVLTLTAVTAPVAFGFVPREYPIFIAASDAAQTLTMLSEIPKDVAIDGAELTIDINPTTTVASQMICPGGVYPPPANGWCYSDPKTPSADNTAMISLLDKALGGTLINLDTGSPPRA